MTIYRASAVKFPFWQSEFDQLLRLRLDGEDWEQLHDDVIEHNSFNLPSHSRRQSLFSTLQKRINSLAQEVIDMYEQLNVDNQKLINLVGIMNVDPVVQTFILRTFRNELLVGDRILEPFEMEAFFKQLEVEHVEVSEWTADTVKRLSATIRNYLRQAGLAQDTDRGLQVLPPLLDIRLSRMLEAVGHRDYVLALTGR